MADYRAMAGDAAVAHGLPSDRFDRQIGVESVNYAINVIECRLDSPAGARGIAQLMPLHWSQVDPCDPHAALDYAARLMRGHWDFWKGQGKDAETAYGLALASYNAGRQATIDGLAGRKAWWPFAETIKYLTRILQVDEGQARAIMTGSSNVPSPLPFNPDARIDIQPNDWSCALQATQWLLRSIGRNPDASDPVGDPWLTSQLVPSVIRPDVGLLKATGEDLAAWLNREYGAGMGFTAQYAPVTFDDVLAGAGTNPTIIGGRTWNHWSGVRRVNPDGTLALANPAPGFKGVGDQMSREQWAQLGPFSAIYVDRAAMLGVQPDPPVHPDELEPVRQKLREAIAMLDDFIEAR